MMEVVMMRRCMTAMCILVLLCLVGMPLFAIETSASEAVEEVVVIEVVSVPVVSSTTKKAVFDLGITFGHGALSFNKYTGPGLSMTLGLTMGLSQRMEIDLVSLIELVPRPFGDIVVGAEVAYALLGERSFGDNRAGIGINTYLSAGLLFSNHTPNGNYAPTYLTLSVTPVAVGSPYSGKRERLAKMGVAWNFMDNSVSMYWSVALYDYYLVGTWRDYQ